MCFVPFNGPVGALAHSHSVNIKEPNRICRAYARHHGIFRYLPYMTHPANTAQKSFNGLDAAPSAPVKRDREVGPASARFQQMPHLCPWPLRMRFPDGIDARQQAVSTEIG